MDTNEKQKEKTILAHWVYTREEWKAFMRWKKLQKSIFHFFIHRLIPRRKKRIPEITITSVKVWIDDAQESFNNGKHKLQRINIRDAGSINVMEISYDSYNKSSAVSNEIKIPVPKGRLKEAIQVQEKLSNPAIMM